MTTMSSEPNRTEERTNNNFDADDDNKVPAATLGAIAGATGCQVRTMFHLFAIVQFQLNK